MGTDQSQINLKVVGKPLPLLEGRDKVTGSAKYSADIQLPGMLHCKILGSPYPHAIIKKIDVTAAEAIDGVVHILTHENTTGITYQSVETRRACVLDQHVRYMGEPVACVAAETEEVAEKAVGTIRVEYEVLPAVFDPFKAAQSDAPQLHPDGNIADPEPGKPLVIEWGDVEKAFAEADIIVEGTFRTPAQPVTPIEPRATVAHWNGEILSAWVSTQFPHRVKEDIAGVTGLSFSQISVKSKYLGGGFGGKKQEEHPLMAALITMRTGLPVKIEYSREEETIIGRRRYSSINTTKMAAKKDGTITGMVWETYHDVGALGNSVGGCLDLLPGCQEYGYKIDNCILRSYDVNTNLPTAQPFRGVQMPAFLFAVEQLVDQVAEKAGLNPVEIRLKNTYRKGDITKPFGARLGNFALEDCMDAALKESGFHQTWKGWGKPTKVEGAKKAGIGISYMMGYTEWMKHRASATVKICPDGTADIICGAQDLGTGCNTTIAQIGAEELGLPFEKVRYITGDTAITPDDWGSCGSRTLFCAGTAVQEAAKKAKKALIDAAALTLKMDKNDLEFTDGELLARGKKTLLAELFTAPICASYKNPETPCVAPFFIGYYAGGPVVHVAEVEVDTETGQVEIKNYTIVQDAGRAIDPLIVEGQMYGGFLQGLGFSLCEELLFSEDGRPLNPNFMDYKIFDFQDAPAIKTIMVQSHEPTGPFGALGVGEHTLSPVAGAVANAIYNAIGVRMTQCPMTPERVLEALDRQTASAR